MSRIALVVGANGQLGSDVCREFAAAGWTVAPLTPDDLDLAAAGQEVVTAAVRRHGPSVVVNCAAYTNVDKAEDERDLAFALNATAARRLATAAQSADALFVHVSTDYVFDGAKRRPYVEDDTPNPLQVYGDTKLWGERYVAEAAARHAIVRSSGLYGETPSVGKGGANFVETMLRLGRERDELSVVNDEIVTPAWTKNLAVQMERIATAGATGLFHATPQGEVSWHDFAAAIFELAGIQVRLKPIPALQYPSKAKRPPYSVLDNARLRALGLDVMPGWKDGLRGYLRAVGATA